MSIATATYRPVQALLPMKRTARGLRTQQNGWPFLFSDIAARLRHLSSCPETELARAEVQAVLNYPWSGLRILAIRVIATWGGAANKAWLIQHACPSYDLSGEVTFWEEAERKAALRGLAPLLGHADAHWALTLYLNGAYGWHELYNYVGQTPDAAFLAWLPTPLREARSLTRVRLVNMVGRRPTLPGYMAIMHSLADGEDHAAETVRGYIAKTEGR